MSSKETASYSQNAYRVAFPGCRFGALSSAPFPFWCSLENGIPLGLTSAGTAFADFITNPVLAWGSL